MLDGESSFSEIRKKFGEPARMKKRHVVCGFLEMVNGGSRIFQRSCDGVARTREDLYPGGRVECPLYAFEKCDVGVLTAHGAPDVDAQDVLCAFPDRVAL